VVQYIFFRENAVLRWGYDDNCFSEDMDLRQVFQRAQSVYAGDSAGQWINCVTGDLSGFFGDDGKEKAA